MLKFIANFNNHKQDQTLVFIKLRWPAGRLLLLAGGVPAILIDADLRYQDILSVNIYVRQLLGCPLIQRRQIA